jgi:hypothetical protein
MVQILCTHACNGKSENCETIQGMEKGRIKENNGGMDSTMIHCKNFCEYHNVCPAQQ